MRRIEQDEIERIIGKRHLAEVPDDIGPDLQSAPIAKGMFLAAAVHEDRIGVVFVEPAHPTAAASIQNLFIRIAILKFLVIPLLLPRHRNPF